MRYRLKHAAHRKMRERASGTTPAWPEPPRVTANGRQKYGPPPSIAHGAGRLDRPLLPTAQRAGCSFFTSVVTRPSNSPAKANTSRSEKPLARNSR